MTKENFQDISITEIAQTAELSRKTLDLSQVFRHDYVEFLTD